MEQGELWTYDRGNIIYSQGECSQGILYLHKGRLKISIYHEDGREKTLGVQEAPATVGEIAAFDGHPYFCTATAISPCHIYLFRRNVVAKLMRDNPELSISLLGAVGRKYRALALQVEDLAFLEAPARIAHLLEKLLAELGLVTTEGEALSIGLSHQELADMAATSRVTVTICLNKLQKRGIIRKTRRGICVDDIGRLQEPPWHASHERLGQPQ
ncbi:MAG: Crp/Fnr family transcriptional regulator [Dehalococcoidia bacterium]|nr:Crp/Fnr family transcriptional regulator [Dehalococcoidia bacterium]